MWKPEQLLEGKDFDPVFAHAIVRKYPELYDILWDACFVSTEDSYHAGYSKYQHYLSLSYKGEDVATLSSGWVYEKQFYNFILGS